MNSNNNPRIMDDYGSSNETNMTEGGYIKTLIKSIEDHKALHELMDDIILNDPEGNPQFVTDVRAAESGEPALVIETKGVNSKWRHTIKTEEIL